MTAKVGIPIRSAPSIKVPGMLNTALKAKSWREQDKLKDMLAEQLREDMKRLLDEGTFADLTLSIHSERMPVHCQLLKARLNGFFSSMVEPRMMRDKEGEEMVADLSTLDISAMDLKNLLRAIYTEDNVRPFWNVFRDLVKSQDSDEEGHKCSDRRLTPQEPGGTGCHQEEMNEVTAGNQTDGAAALSVQVRQLVPLQNAELQVGCEPKTVVQRTQQKRIGQSGEPKACTPPVPSKSARSQGPSTSQAATGLEPGARPKVVHDKVTVTETDPSSMETTKQGQSSINSEDTLPAAACHLGEVFLRFLQEESGHDVIIKVEEREIHAHRFMLCARSEYFSAMLLGSWKESTTSEIEIKGFSYSAVMVAVQCIYGGTYKLPDGRILRDLCFLADMYNLNMLKDVVDLKLTMDYCHFFHKPCRTCLARIPEWFVLFSNIKMFDLEERILSWLVEYLDRVWKEKAFAGLPQDLLFKCRDYAIRSFTTKSVTPLLLQIDKLVCNLPYIKWANPVLSIAMQLRSACMQYMATNFLAIVREHSFRQQLKGMNWKKELVEPVFSRVVPALTRDTTNATFNALVSLYQEVNRKDGTADGWNRDAVSMVNQMYEQLYKYMVSHASRQIQAPAWDSIPDYLREQIELDAVVIDSRAKCRHASQSSPVL